MSSGIAVATKLNEKVLNGTAVRINPSKTQDICEGYKTSSTPLSYLFTYLLTYLFTYLLTYSVVQSPS